MKKITLQLLTMCFFAVASVSCEDEKMLEVNLTNLTFEALASEAQTVTVVAKNVGWDFSIDSEASAWLEAKREGNDLLITVKDNTGIEKRTGSIVLTPDFLEMSPIRITITQKPISSDPELILSASSLKLAGDNVVAQEVTVTMRGEGFTWTAEVDKAAAEWLNVETVDGKIIVSASDNLEAKARTGKINIVPSKKTIATKTILVTQEVRVLPPSMKLSSTEDIKFLSYDTNIKRITVAAVNCTWTVAARDDADKGVAWLLVEKQVNGKESNFTVRVATNEGAERVANVVVTSSDETIPVIKIKVTQAEGTPFISTLTEDVEVATTKTQKRITVNAKESWETKTTVSSWNFNVMSSGVSFVDNSGSWPYKESYYTGTGDRLCLDLASPVVRFNDDGEYFIPEGQDYEVQLRTTSEQARKPFSIEGGRLYSIYTRSQGTSAAPSALHPNGSWYYKLENGQEVAQAPIVEGTLKVSRKGEIYTLTIDFKDDAGNKITGTYKGELFFRPLSDPQPDPSLPPAPEEPEEPGGGGGEGPTPFK